SDGFLSKWLLLPEISKKSLEASGSCPQPPVRRQQTVTPQLRLDPALSFSLRVFARIKCKVTDFASKTLAASKDFSIKNHAGSDPNIQTEDAKIALAHP